MKKLVLTLAAFVLSVAFVAPAAAKDRRIDRAPSILECGLFFIPANCSPLDRIVGGAIVGGALGFGVGAIVGAAGGTIVGGALGFGVGAIVGAAGGSIAGGTLAATSTVGVAGSYAVIGAGAGAATGLLIAR